MPTLLLEGPFESDYSLAIVNRRLAEAMIRIGVPIRLHQRDNNTSYFPSEPFLSAGRELAPLFVRDVQAISADVHSRNIYPPYTDTFRGRLRVMHNYGWEESGFPAPFVKYFNDGLDLVTTTSEFVRQVLRENGVKVPIEVVGNGADHILSVASKPLAGLRPATFDFLHVSSCFPRKAPEVLVRAFCEEFMRWDDVRLIIKTFPNPHNEIERIVHEIGWRYPNHAPIEVVTASLDLGEMRYLYESAGCLISASRGEGFGLPVAEAMFMGCPVIATIQSGQADICSPDNCWPVDFEVEPAHSHLTEGASFWANPRVESLREQMRNVYRASARGRQERTDRARQFVQDRFTWQHVAERNWRLCMAALESKQSTVRSVPKTTSGSPPAIAFVTTWNTRCGIAEYTRYLATSLDAAHRIAIFANSTQEEFVRPDEDFVGRCWELRNDTRSGAAEVEELAQAILQSGVRAVSIQFNFGFFTPPGLHALIARLRREGLVTAVTLHAVKHENFPRLKPALELADFCICHRQADVDAVRRLGLNNVLLRKHGIVASQLAGNSTATSDSQFRPHFVIGSFGFFLPPKGIYQLIQAFALANTVQPLLRLKLLNSLYPAEASSTYARQCMRLIEEKQLQGNVLVCTEFRDHEETLQELADCDLIVLPYLHSTESSSGAAAFALASLRPVLCSDLPLFDEVAGVVHRFPAGNVITLANRILQLAGDPTELHRNRIAQEECVRSLAWPVVAQDFLDLVNERINRSRSAAAF